MAARKSIVSEKLQVDRNTDFLAALKAVLETPAQKGGLTNRVVAWQVYHDEDFPVAGKDPVPTKR